jgi:putative membrane protein
MNIMKSLLRNFLIHLVTLMLVAKILPGFTYSGGLKVLILGTLAFMLINVAVVPLLKVMFLPLNLITLGIFTWVINVIGLYLLTTVIPNFRLMPYNFEGAQFGIIVLPPTQMNVLMVAILASFLVGLISHFLQWLYSGHH